MDHDTKRPEYPEGENTSELGDTADRQSKPYRCGFDVMAEDCEDVEYLSVREAYPELFPKGERRHELEWDEVPDWLIWLIWSIVGGTAALFLIVYFYPAAGPVAG